MDYYYVDGSDMSLISLTYIFICEVLNESCACSYYNNVHIRLLLS